MLVTGPTGSGKSTTLAAMLDLINDDAPRAHPHDRGPDRVPAQAQEAASSTSASWAPTRRASRSALKAALRQDPDVILVGEMRDLETISTALTAAETGHLVFATLHTQDTAQTVDRIVDVFPPDAAAAGARAAVGGAPGHRHPAAAADRRRQGPLRGHRGARADPRGPQPDPRGQDPPDLLRAPDRRAARHADDGRLAGPSSCASGKITRELAEARSSHARGAAPPHGHGEGWPRHGHLRIQGTRPRGRPHQGRDRGRRQAGRRVAAARARA